MNKYLPSKKFIKFFGGVLAVVAVVVGFSLTYSNKGGFVADNTAAAVSSGSDNPYEADSDEDGVFDWEEGLWGTDPRNKDSNGDGVSDAEDIATKKEQIEKEGEPASTDFSSNEGLNQTEIFAKQLLSTASLANQQGGLTDESIESFSKSISSSIINTAIPDMYTLADIKLSLVSPSAYKANIIKVFKPYQEANIPEIGLIDRLVNGDPGAERDADKLITIYANLSQDLLKLEVPHSIAGTHLVLINSAAKLSAVFANFKQVGDDPLSAVSGFKGYEKYSAEIESAFIRLTDYFRSTGV